MELIYVIETEKETWDCGSTLSEVMEECQWLNCDDYNDVTIVTYLVDSEGKRIKIDEYCYR